MMIVEALILSSLSVLRIDGVSAQKHTSGCILPDVTPEESNCMLPNGIGRMLISGQEAPFGTICYFSKHGETVMEKCRLDGDWHCDTVKSVTCEVQDAKNHSRKKRFLIFALYCLITGCWNRKPKDTTSPEIRNCPGSQDHIADKGQFYTKVVWAEPTAYDNKDGVVKMTRSGLGPGKLFTGNTVITYYAKDRRGNRNQCSFSIRVKVIKCKQMQSLRDGYKWCAPSTYMMYGTRCSFGCYSGHELIGPSSITCLSTGEWDDRTKPYCQKKQCPEQANRQFGIRTKSCTDGNYYRSICSFSCTDGYGTLPGFSKVQVCSSSGAWKGEEPVCVDTEPPRFENCQPVKQFYADRSSNKGKVDWVEPIAEDNSLTVSVYQKSGPKPGATLSVGVYDVIYEAYDGVNNSATCAFQVIVKQIRCYTISPLPYSSVSCPEGTRYGALCEFTCDNGTSLTGQRHTQCEKSDGIYPYGYWTFSNHQPYCTVQVLCSALEPPANGAVACDVWKSGPLCIPMCQNGYYFAYEHKGNHSLLTCEASGQWKLEANLLEEVRRLPSCNKVAERQVRWVKAAAYFYFSGNCNDVKDEIKDNFRTALHATNFFLNRCKDVTGCSINNIEVQCGKDDVHIRKKRSTNDQHNLSLHIKFIVGSPADSSFGKAEIGKLRYHLAEVVTAVAKNETQMMPNGNWSLEYISSDVSQVFLECEDGTEQNMELLKCVLCNPGYFHDPSKKQCLKCPRGQYQPEAGKTVCIQCPKTMTTVEEGSESLLECVASCAPGYFSSTGIPPCTPCRPGSYSPAHGTITCTPCPGSQTTEMDAVTSVSQCYEYDVVFPTGFEETLKLTFDVIQQIDSIYMSLWMQCIICNNTSLISMQANGGELFLLEYNDRLQLNLDTTTYLMFTKLDGRWHNIQTALNRTHLSLRVDTVEKTWNVTSVFLQNGYFPGQVNVTIGGKGFAGVLTQLHIWSYESPHLRTAASLCFISGEGDLFSWRSFSETYMPGTFVQRSFCDDFNNCDSSPCEHGTCTDGLNSYTCSCDIGYTGKTCNHNINDCMGAVCDNDGVCVDGVNSYSCLCTSGYTGNLCETKVVDGGFGVWSNWSKCSTTCGEGNRTRYRACDTPPPDNGGLECLGDIIDTEVCNIGECVYECDTLPEVVNGEANCTETEDAWVCHPYCNENHDFDRPLPLEVICGPGTNNEWNFVNDENPNGDLPTCTEIKDPKQNNLDFKGTYPELICGDSSHANTRSEIHEVISTKVKELDCIVEGICQDGGVDIDGCDGINRQKRSTSGVQVKVRISCEAGRVGLEPCLQALVATYQELISFVESFSFTITEHGTEFNIDLNTTGASGGVTCGFGEIPVNYYCVPCGVGTYKQNEECVTCSHGFYQNGIGQQTCKQCPDGFTTRGRGARLVTQCNVSSPPEESYWLVAVLVPSLVVVAAMLTALIVMRCKKKSVDIQMLAVNKEYGDVALLSFAPNNKRFDPRAMSLEADRHLKTVDE